MVAERLSGMTRKRRFDIDAVLTRIREAVIEHADAAMFELRDRGFGSVFQQLVACIISIRTRDEVSLPIAIKLFERAPTAARIAKLSVTQIDAIIRASSFHAAKAARFARSRGARCPSMVASSRATSTC